VATLTVWKFDDPDGAEKVLQELGGLQKQALLKVLDGAVVSWPAEAKRPRTSQLADMTGRGALGGAFWGFLFGLLFFVPLLGLAVGAAAGALGGSMANVGIDKDFIEQVKAKVTPGTSALFVLSSDEVEDRVLPTFERAGAELIKTNLSAEQEAQLREAFAEEESQAKPAAAGSAPAKAADTPAPGGAAPAPKPGPPKPGPVPKPGPPSPAREAGAAAAREAGSAKGPAAKSS
jgi:uncharacterized membrane protein